MKDQKISTMLGAIILIIIAATVAGFVILCFKKYPVESDIEPFVISQDKEKNVHEGTSEKSVSITNKGDRNYVTYVDGTYPIY